MAYVKRAAEVKDYRIDWAPHLLVNGVAGDTVNSSTWIVETGLTNGPPASTSTTTTTTVWLSGGIAGTEYTVTNRVTTIQGRTYEESIVVTITAPPVT